MNAATNATTKRPHGELHLREIMQGIDSLGGGDSIELDPTRPIDGDFREGLERLVERLARAGWTVGPNGTVRESWRERAASAWVPYAESFPWIEGAGAVRFVEGILCEAFDATGDGSEWVAEVGDESATLATEAEARAYAIRRARVLAR